MMKILFGLSILTLTACSNSADDRNDRSSKDTTSKVTNNTSLVTSDTLGTNGVRNYIDSANFHIIRGRYISGATFIESYQNNLTKLDTWKEFYENGQLKEEGTMTNGHHILVGTWKYCSPEGMVDSIVDFDKKYPISYFEALIIAEKKGFTMPDMEVTLYVDNETTFWQVARWKQNENEATAEAILIDTKTGKVIRPTVELRGIY